jgi:hypothetical protein
VRSAHNYLGTDRFETNRIKKKLMKKPAHHFENCKGIRGVLLCFLAVFLHEN